MGKLRVNLQDDTAEDEFELKEVEVVTAPPANESFETTMFATEIIKGDPEHRNESLKVDHNAGLNCIVTSPDGLITASAGEGAIIHVIDENAGAESQTIKVSDGTVVTIAFNPKTSEGVPILYAGTDEGYNKPGKIYVVDLSSSTITNTFEGHTRGINNLAGETVDILEENSPSCLPNFTTLCASL